MQVREDQEMGRLRWRTYLKRLGRVQCQEIVSFDSISFTMGENQYRQFHVPGMWGYMGLMSISWTDHSDSTPTDEPNFLVYASATSIPDPNNQIPIQNQQYVIASGMDDTADWHILVLSNNIDVPLTNLTVAVQRGFILFICHLLIIIRDNYSNPKPTF